MVEKQLTHLQKANSMFTSLIGYSSNSDDNNYESDEDENDDVYAYNDPQEAPEDQKQESLPRQINISRTQPIPKSERHIERLECERGQHIMWQWNVLEKGTPLIFAVFFVTDGFRTKPIKIIVREEMEYKWSSYPIYGDFVILKKGKIEFHFRNLPKNKRIHVKYKIEKKYINK